MNNPFFMSFDVTRLYEIPRINCSPLSCRYPNIKIKPFVVIKKSVARFLAFTS